MRSFYAQTWNYVLYILMSKKIKQDSKLPLLLERCKIKIYTNFQLVFVKVNMRKIHKKPIQMWIPV